MAVSAFPIDRQRDSGKPSALACQDCRKKHLKCDGSSPGCSRCSKNGLHCVYVPSRRGYQRPATHQRNLVRHRCLGSPSRPAAYMAISSTTLPSTTRVTHDSVQSLKASLVPQRNADDSLQPLSQPDIPFTTTMIQDEEYFTNLFYSHFHPAHPFLLPRSRYQSQSCPPHLRLVVQFIGSHYAPSRSSEGLEDVIDATLGAISEDTVHMVQSLLLFAIVLHFRLELTKASETLTRASEMAINLGMNRLEFAGLHGLQDPLLEESLRRTWWELYVIDGYFTSLHRLKIFTCNSVELTANLPCNESTYIQGMLPISPVSLRQFDQRFFNDEDSNFSSGCYRIAAVRILAQATVSLSRDDDTLNNTQDVDNALGAWKYHLPCDKAEVFNGFGALDQMMLQAHSFINLIHILVHFPRSELLLKLPPFGDISCLKRIDPGFPIMAQHAVKAISASKSLSNLAALPVETHSPLFICCLVFCGIVQISSCSAYENDRLIQHRERVALITGLIKRMGRVWPLAQDVLRYLNRIASAKFKSCCPLDSDTNLTPSDSAVDMNNMSDTFSWLDQLFGGEANISGELPNAPFSIDPRLTGTEFTS